MQEYRSWLQQYQHRPEVRQHFLHWYQQNIQKKENYLAQNIEAIQYFAETGFLTEEDLELFFNYLQLQTAIHEVVHESETLNLMTVSERPTLILPRKSTNQDSATALPQKIGPYEIVHLLGKGGMGTVYKVRHQDLQTIYALKVIPLSEQINEETLARFQKEAQISAKLNHPNIIQVNNFGKERDHYYLCMEFVDGITLTQFIAQDFSMRHGLMIIQKVLEALDYAHLQGVIHRDIKPENIFLTKENEPKISDFGLAKDLRIDEKIKKLTQSGTILGTPAYMPPEQVLGKSDLTATTDIYAMGICLYELLTKKTPYTGKNIHEIFYQILHTEPPPPSSIHPKIHRDLDTIILKAIEKDPTKRYQKASEFAEEIRRFLEGYPIQARPQRWHEKLRKWSGRNRKLVFSGCFLFVLLLLLMASWPLWYQLERRNQKSLLTQQSIHFQKQAEENQNIQERLLLFLDALNALNQALTLFPKNLELEQEKIQLLEKLVPLACQENAYELANYLVQEAETVLTDHLERQQQLLQIVDRSRYEQKNKNLKKFESWLQKLVTQPLEEAFLKDAIFEIVQIQEPEVLERLLQILDESVHFFPKSASDPLKKQFFRTLIIALGRKNHPDAQQSLIQALRSLSTRVWSIPAAQRSFEDIEWMILLTQALADSSTPNISSSLFSLRSQMGQGSVFWDKTEKAYQKLAKIDGNQKNTAMTADEYHQRGNVKYSQGDYEGAIQDYTQAIRLNPNKAISYANRGISKKNRGDYDGAMIDYNQAIRLDPKDSGTFSNRGLTRSLKGDYAGAIQDYNQAILLSPQNGLYYANRGLAKMNKKELDSAIEDCTKAIQLSPDYLPAYNHRGTCKYLKKDYEGALADFSKILQINPASVETHYNVGCVYWEKGDKVAAREEFMKLLNATKDKNTPEIQKNREVIKQLFPDLFR